MKLFKVQGNSMHPLLRDSDYVVVQETTPASLRRGNILVYRSWNGEYVAHRLIKRGKGALFGLRGDGYALPLEWAPAEAILGKAVGFVRNRRYDALDRQTELRSWSVSLCKEYAKRLMRRAGCGHGIEPPCP